MNQYCIIQYTMYVTKNESEMRGLCQLQNKIYNLQRPNKTKEIRDETNSVRSKSFRTDLLKIEDTRGRHITFFYSK